MVRTLFTSVLLALALAPGALGAQSSANCPRRIVSDWAVDARVDGAYSIGCYRRAISSLPEDLRAYSSAAFDIQRALQEELASTPVTPATDAAAAVEPLRDQGGSSDALVRVLILATSITIIGALAVAGLR